LGGCRGCEQRREKQRQQQSTLQHLLGAVLDESQFEPLVEVFS
jgi:hypothetical protein